MTERDPVALMSLPLSRELLAPGRDGSVVLRASATRLREILPYVGVVAVLSAGSAFRHAPVTLVSVVLVALGLSVLFGAMLLPFLGGVEQLAFTDRALHRRRGLVSPRLGSRSLVSAAEVEGITVEPEMNTGLRRSEVPSGHVVRLALRGRRPLLLGRRLGLSPEKADALRQWIADGFTER